MGRVEQTVDENQQEEVTPKEMGEKSDYVKAVESNPIPGPTGNPVPDLEPYIGTKVVKAAPLSLNDWQKKAGKTITNDDAPGYMVEYDDGYQSWSPAPVFERCYRLLTPSERAMVL